MALKLTPRILLLFSAFAALLLSGLGGLVYSSARSSLTQAIEADLLSNALEKRAALEGWLSERQGDLVVISQSPTLRSNVEQIIAAGAAHSQVLEELKAHIGPGMPMLRLFVMHPESGLILVATNPADEGKRHESAAYFLNGRDRPYVQNVQYLADEQRVAMFVSMPLRGPSGRLAGVLVGEVNLTDLTAIIQRHPGLRRSEDSFLINPSGLFVTQPLQFTDPAVLRRGVNTAASRLCLAGGSGSILAKDYLDTPAIVRYEWMGERQLCLIITLDQRDAFAPSDDLGWQILAIGGLMLGLGLAIAALLARTVTGPIIALQQGVLRIAAGERGLRLTDSSPDEVGDLARSFNNMVETLSAQEAELQDYAEGLEQVVAERTKDLQASEERFRGAFEQAAVGIAHVSPSGRFIRINQRFCAIMGYTHADLTALTFQDITHPDDVGVDLHFLGQLLAGELSQYSLEKRYIRKGGQLVWVNLSASLMRDPTGRPDYLIAVVEDITERKRLSQELAESEAQHRLLIQHLQAGIVVHAADTSILLSNPEASRLLGLTVEQMMGKTAIDPAWYFMRDNETIMPLDEYPVNRVLATREPLSNLVVGVNRPSTNDRVWALASAFPQFDLEGDLDQVIVTFVDITARKRAEAQIAYQASLLEWVDDAIIASDAQFHLRAWNTAAERLYGWRADEVLGRNGLDFIHTEWPDDQVEEMRHKIAEMGSWRGEAIQMRRDGTRFPVEVSSLVLRDSGGQITGYVSSNHDITERKRLLEKLTASEERFRNTFEQAAVGIGHCSPDGRFLRLNQRFCDIVGYTHAEIITLAFQDITYPDDLAADLHFVARLITGELSQYSMEKRYVRKDSRVVWVHLSTSLIRDADGRPDYLVSVVEDISERKRIATELQLSAEELIRSNADLEQFAYVASHDLQEPLRMVSSYTQLLARRYKGQLDADADEFISYAVDGATRMQRLIHDLLAYSRVGTRGKQFTPVDCEMLLQQVLANLALTIEESNATVTHTRLPTLEGDATQLLQLFQNMIGNALKFRRAEPPLVHVSTELRDSHWLFCIRDNGIGIEPAYFERAFVIFQRLHTREEYAGTGIGLAICKKIVTRHGGRIWIESAPGQGTSFFFTIPAAADTTHAPLPAEAHA